MAVGFSTVSVVTAERRVDLALPSGVPVGEWFPELLRLCDARKQGQGADWVLGPVGGPTIGFDTTLEASGISDGQILQLRPAESDGIVAYVDDFVDTVADRVDDKTDRWTKNTSASFTTLLASAGLLLLLYTTFARGGAGALSLFFDLVVSVALALAAAMWARREHVFGAGVLAVTALVWWTATGVLLGGYLGGAMFGVALGAVGFAIGGGVVRVSADRLAGPAAFAWSVSALLAAAAVAVLLGVPLAAVLCAVIVLCVLVLGILPLTALGAGGLAAMDYRIRAGQRLASSAIERAVWRASGILAWTLTGVGLVATGVAGYVALNGDTWPRVLAGLAGVALLLRSRAYTRRAHALPVRLAGSAVVVAMFARLVLDREPGEVLLVVLLAAALIGLSLLSVVPVNDVLSARLRLLGNYAEIAIVILLVPVLMQIFGLFAWIKNLVGT